MVYRSIFVLLLSIILPACASQQRACRVDPAMLLETAVPDGYWKIREAHSSDRGYIQEDITYIPDPNDDIRDIYQYLVNQAAANGRWHVLEEHQTPTTITSRWALNTPLCQPTPIATINVHMVEHSPETGGHAYYVRIKIEEQ